MWGFCPTFSLSLFLHFIYNFTLFSLIPIAKYANLRIEFPWLKTIISTDFLLIFCVWGVVNVKKKMILGGVALILVGAGIFGGTQYVMKATSSTEFCVSCHSMTHPQAEWEGSVHFSNRKGIRAECADCHVPQDDLHYVKAKVVALKDVWHTFVTNKLPDQEAYEANRLEMAQRVWAEMKETDSATCRSCHSFDAMLISEQKEAAQKMHKLAQETNQTCIDCHKGIAHQLPNMHGVKSGFAPEDKAKE